MYGQFGDLDAVIVEPGEDSAQFCHAAAGGYLQRERLLVGPAGPPSASPDPAAPPNDRLGLAERVRVGEPEPDVHAGDHALELVRRALGDQRAVVKQRDLVRLVARIGPLEIKTKGEALQDGKIGDLIRVKNIDSNAIVLGRKSLSMLECGAGVLSNSIRVIFAGG